MLNFVGRTSESVKLGRVCLELRREILGNDHPDTIDCLSDLAAALESQDDLELSKRMQRQALQASERVLGPEHPDTLNCKSHLAGVLEEHIKSEEAEVAPRRLVKLENKGFSDGMRQHNLAFTLSK